MIAAASTVAQPENTERAERNYTFYYDKATQFPKDVRKLETPKVVGKRESLVDLLSNAMRCNESVYLEGPCGSGKTKSIRCIADSLNYRVIVPDIDEAQPWKEITKAIDEASISFIKQRSLLDAFTGIAPKNGTVVLVDDADILGVTVSDDNEDAELVARASTSAKNLATKVRRTKNVCIMFVVNSSESENLRTIRNACIHQLKIERPSDTNVITMLSRLNTNLIRWGYDDYLLRRIKKAKRELPTDASKKEKVALLASEHGIYRPSPREPTSQNLGIVAKISCGDYRRAVHFFVEQFPLSKGSSKTLEIDKDTFIRMHVRSPFDSIRLLWATNGSSDGRQIVREMLMSMDSKEIYKVLAVAHHNIYRNIDPRRSRSEFAFKQVSEMADTYSQYNVVSNKMWDHALVSRQATQMLIDVSCSVRHSGLFVAPLSVIESSYPPSQIAHYSKSAATRREKLRPYMNGLGCSETELGYLGQIIKGRSRLKVAEASLVGRTDADTNYCSDMFNMDRTVDPIYEEVTGSRTSFKSIELTSLFGLVPTDFTKMVVSSPSGFGGGGGGGGGGGSVRPSSGTKRKRS